jgi:hypothetical protein
MFWMDDQNLSPLQIALPQDIQEEILARLSVKNLSNEVGLLVLEFYHVKR